MSAPMPQSQPPVTVACAARVLLRGPEAQWQDAVVLSIVPQPLCQHPDGRVRLSSPCDDFRLAVLLDGTPVTAAELADFELHPELGCVTMRPSEG